MKEGCPSVHCDVEVGVPVDFSAEPELFTDGVITLAPLRTSFSRYLFHSVFEATHWHGGGVSVLIDVKVFACFVICAYVFVPEAASYFLLASGKETFSVNLMRRIAFCSLYTEQFRSHAACSCLQFMQDGFSLQPFSLWPSTPHLAQTALPLQRFEP